MLPFPLAWEKVCFRDGWLTEGEAAVLYAYACELPENSRIVEIGAYQGKSTLLLAQTGHQIVTIDPLEEGYGDGNDMKVRLEHAERFANTVASIKNIEWLRCKSQDVSRFEPMIDMCYIDGDHLAPNPLRDFRQLRHSLKPGAVVAWHDYDNGHEDVRKTVDYLLDSKQLQWVAHRGSLVITRIPVVEPQDREVTGFNLFVLNHMFPRRCEEFIKSLDAQLDLKVPIHLTYFYERQRDLDVVLQNCSKKIELQPIQVSDGAIMNRAPLFSLTIPEKVYSHVVFTDCDLVFPMDFFAQYRNLLQDSEPGYWSCFVEDISIDDTQMLLNADAISDAHLDRYSVGPRYDWGHGTAGHFQCVPHKLASYPNSKVRGVSQADDEFARWAIKQSLNSREERRLGIHCYHLGHPFSWFGTSIEL